MLTVIWRQHIIRVSEMEAKQMKRYAMEQLVSWKDKPNRKPLILKGARQVGKTWLMKEFGRQYFKKVAYVTFYNNQRMKRVFDDDYDIGRILMNINIETKLEVTPGDTLIIFDEIQEAPRALESLKYFCENAPEYAVVAAGSLLGVAIHEGVSYPVGKVDTVELHPMSFREFLEAMGEGTLANIIASKDYTLMSDCSSKYIFWLKNYYYVGGMPEIVQYFAEHKDYQEVRRMQKSILDQYEDDFGKHASSADLARIRMVWNSIPMQLAKENKKFFFGRGVFFYLRPGFKIEFFIKFIITFGGNNSEFGREFKKGQPFRRVEIKQRVVGVKQ